MLDDNIKLLKKAIAYFSALVADQEEDESSALYCIAISSMTERLENLLDKRSEIRRYPEVRQGYVGMLTAEVLEKSVNEARRSPLIEFVAMTPAFEEAVIVNNLVDECKRLGVVPKRDVPAHANVAYLRIYNPFDKKYH